MCKIDYWLGNARKYKYMQHAIFAKIAEIINTFIFGNNDNNGAPA